LDGFLTGHSIAVPGDGPLAPSITEADASAATAIRTQPGRCQNCIGWVSAPVMLGADTTTQMPAPAAAKAARRTQACTVRVIWRGPGFLRLIQPANATPATVQQSVTVIA